MALGSCKYKRHNTALHKDVMTNAKALSAQNKLKENEHLVSSEEIGVSISSSAESCSMPLHDPCTTEPHEATLTDYTPMFSDGQRLESNVQYAALVRKTVVNADEGRYASMSGCRGTDACGQCCSKENYLNNNILCKIDVKNYLFC